MADNVQRCTYIHPKVLQLPTNWTAHYYNPLIIDSNHATCTIREVGNQFCRASSTCDKTQMRRYIIMAMKYDTKMVKQEATRRQDAATVAKFLYESIITRY